MRCFFYWILEPPPERITDKNGRTLAYEVTVNYNDRAHQVALFTNEAGQPEFVRLTLQGIEQESLPEELLPFIQSMREHVLTTLHLGYDQRAQYFPIHFWNFQSDRRGSTTDVRLTLHGMRAADADLLRNVFTSTINYREHFRLYSNGTNEGIPQQYRFLSLYKLLEMQYRKGGDWSPLFRSFVDSFNKRFSEKGIDRDFVGLLHRYRDKCAHVRTGKKHQLLGVSELNHKELVALEKLLPIMAEMGASILTELTRGSVTVKPMDRDAEWKHEAERAASGSAPKPIN
jgi:hypothetical protein